MTRYCTLLVATGLLAGCIGSNQADESLAVIRVGYFPNITHAQALVGLADGTFQQALGDITIEPYTFNAGPTEIEAMFAGQIDLAYIGPSPALNAFVQSEGEAIRIISGSMVGGAAFVVQPELAESYRTQGDNAFIGKTFASPQQGNTQDVVLRTYFQDKGLLEQVTISPMANADQLSLFSQKQLDGAWVPEPWVSRLVVEAGGEVLQEDSAVTTVIIVSTDFLEEQPTVVKQWLQGQRQVTDWIIANPAAAQTLVNAQLAELSGSPLATAVLATAWDRLSPTVTPDQAGIETMRTQAEALGFIDSTGLDFNQLYDFTLLSEITGQQY